VFKTANEQRARVYWQDEGIRSVGLRPPVGCGVGRDKGLTAGTTLAIQAALLGRPCEIGFSGPANVEYVEDVAACFVASALQAPRGPRNSTAPSWQRAGSDHRLLSTAAFIS
jgi:nucleoside-diphosphate-sugar epimerase